MKISQKGIDFIKGFEGLRLTSYQDQAGIWTVGYGSTGPEIGPEFTISKEEAEELLRQDLSYFERVVNESLKTKVNQNEFDALVSFTFNVGPNAFRASTLLKLINDNSDRTIVASEFLKWVKIGNGKISEGLKRRREAEKSLFLTKPIKAALAHSIVAQQDTWLKRRPVQAQALFAEEKLFVPKNSAHIWNTITMVPGETHYKVHLAAQPDKPWWIFPEHWKIINDPKVSEHVEVKKTSSKILLDVPYFSQRDNARDPMRTCFSSSCAMLLKYLKPKSIKNDDEYVNTVFRRGDTTAPSAQIAALEEYGLRAEFKQTGGWADIDSQLSLGIPVPIGILHKGHVDNPTGGGHWLIVIGRSEDNKSYIVNDPFGDLDLIQGTYINTNGAKLSYSKKNLAPRWMVEGPGSGWYIKAKI